MTLNSSTAADPFDVVFGVFQSLLSSSKSNDGDVKSNLTANKLEDILSATTEKELHSSAVSRLGSMRNLREVTMRRLSSRIEMERVKIEAVQSSYFQAEAACLRHKDVTKRRLAHQVYGAERRMRELVFEIVGEYGKSDIRLARREDYLLQTTQLQLVGQISKLRWQRFMLHICKDSTVSAATSRKRTENDKGRVKPDRLCGKVLCQLNDYSEISVVAAAVEMILTDIPRQTPYTAKVATVVKFSKPQYLSKRSRLNSLIPMSLVPGLACHSGSSNPSVRSVGTTLSRSQSNRYSNEQCIISSSTEFQKAVDQLEQWKASGQSSNKLNQQNTDTNKCQTVSDKNDVENDSSELLSAEHIVWLHPSSYFPALWEKINAGKRLPHNQYKEFLNDKMAKVEHGHQYHMRSNPKNIEDGQGAADIFSFNNFVSKYSLQHTSCLASQRVYVCLEEYALCKKMRLKSVAKQRTPTLDGMRGFSCKELQTLQLYDYLQTKYSSPAAYSAEDSNPSRNIKSLRYILTSKPLYVQQHCSRHRTECEVQDPEAKSPSRHASHAHKLNPLLKIFPDVIKVTTEEGEVLHFAPACALTLLESSALRIFITQQELSVENTEQCMARVARYWSYPDAEYLIGRSAKTHISSGSSKAVNETDTDEDAEGGSTSLVTRLYCIVSGHPLPTPGSDPKGPKTPHSGPQEAPTSFQVMFPLSDACMDGLVHSILPPEERGPNCQDSLHLLPDHACFRQSEVQSPYVSVAYQRRPSSCNTENVKPTGSNLSSVEAVTDTQGPRHLSHSYLLLSGSDISDKFPKHDFQSDGVESYYIVQLDDYNNKAETEHMGGDSVHSSVKADDDMLKRLLLTSTGVNSPKTPGVGPGPGGGGPELSPIPSPAQSPVRSSKNSTLYDTFGAELSLTLTPAPEKEVTEIKNRDGGQVSNPKRWDATVLSTLCRWRSCLCEGKNTSPYLCVYHAELKSFLDRKATSSAPSDATKYLPRRVPNLSYSGSFLETLFGPAIDSRKDLTMIRAASTLLQELWDGKLKATLRSFVKKTAHDMRYKRRLESAATTGHNQQPQQQLQHIKDALPRAISSDTQRGKRSTHVLPASSPPRQVDSPSSVRKAKQKKGTPLSSRLLLMPTVPCSPTWSIWKDKDLLDRTAQESSAARKILQNILGIEKQISAELQALSDLKVFPSQELMLIKKDMKLFKEKTQIAKMEKQEREAAEQKSREEGGKASHSLKGTKVSDSVIDRDSPELSMLEQLVTERKLSLFSERRRTEQEARIILAKKVARLKAMQEAQSKDPLNFTNQKRF